MWYGRRGVFGIKGLSRDGDEDEGTGERND